MIYFDNAATTRPIAGLSKLAEEYQKDMWFNPSAMYPWAVAEENRVSECRRVLAGAINADPKCVIFNSCGTEGANTVILEGYKKQGNKKLHFITTTFEHPCVYNSFKKLEEQGHEVSYVSPRAEGHVFPEDVAALVKENTALVSVMHVNNETGAVNDVCGIASAVKEKNRETLVHVDGVQGYVKCPLNFKDSEIDYYTASAHKLHALKGTGALFYKKGAPIKPYIIGGGQEGALRSGTENTFGIYVFANAVSEYTDNRDEYIENMLNVRRVFLNGFKEIPGVRILSPEKDFAPHILNVSIEAMRGEVLLHLLEKEGIAISTGSACSSKKKKQSRIHAHLKLSRELEEGVIRISSCPYNTCEEAERTLLAINSALKNYRRFIRR